MNKTEGLYYTVLNEQVVQCNLCPHNCLLKPGQQGICKVRYNQGESYIPKYTAKSLP